MINTVKNFPNKPGVYKITSPTGKIYIGEAVNLQTRCKFYLTPNRIKKQRGIYNSLIKHSVESHTIEVLELCNINQLLIRERYWQEFYDSVNSGLNCFLSQTNKKKKVWSEETKKIMSENSKGINNPFYKKNHSEESLKKISESSKGINNPNYGGKFKSEEWLRKQSISNSKKPLKVIDTLTNETYEFINSKETSVFLNCASSSVRESKKHGYQIKKRFIVKNND